MKTEIIYYQKCLCCGKLQAFIMRAKNTNTGLKDSDIYDIISQSCESGNRIIVEYCQECGIHTKQETVAWDYHKSNKCKIPENMLIKDNNDSGSDDK